LFNVDRSVITKHLSNIYKEDELIKVATCANLAQVRTEGNRQVTRDIEFYNLDAIISIGYRVNSQRATQFRQWATSVLSDYPIRGYIIDKKRMENGTFLKEDYFEHLLAEKKHMGLTSWEKSPDGKIVKTDDFDKEIKHLEGKHDKPKG